LVKSAALAASDASGPIDKKAISALEKNSSPKLESNEPSDKVGSLTPLEEALTLDERYQCATMGTVISSVATKAATCTSLTEATAIV